MVKKVEVKEERLILQVENSFYEGWLQEWENLREVERLLRSYAICPADMKLEIQSETDWERVKKIRGKLNRMCCECKCRKRKDNCSDRKDTVFISGEADTAGRNDCSDFYE